MTEAELVTSPSEDEDEGPPPATDCVGGEWSPWGPCMANGRTLDATEDCGQMGVQTKELSGYTPAAHGGTCNTSDTQDCYMPACPPDAPDIQDCIMEPWTSVIGTSQSGETLYMDNVTGAKTCSAVCNTSNMAPGMTYPGGAPGGGKRAEVRGIDTARGKDGGAPCGSVREEYDCNTQDCPQDCSGSWSDDPTATQKYDEFYEQPCKCYLRKKQVYNVRINKLGDGAACEASTGQVRMNRIGTGTCDPGYQQSCGSCFSGDTCISLCDGRVLCFKDVKIGDTLSDGSEVISTLHISNKDKAPYYKIFSQELDKDIYVTGTHLIEEDGKLINVSKSKVATLTDIIDSSVYCFITDTHRITIGEHIFGDWADLCDMCGVRLY